MSLPRNRIRIPIDVSSRDEIVDAVNRSSPAFYRGDDLQFELGIFFATQLQDVSNLAAIGLEVYESQLSETLLMLGEVEAGDINTGLTKEQWKAGTDAHAVIEFGDAETALALDGAKQKVFWLVAYAMTAEGDKFTLGTGPIRCINSNLGASDTPPVAPPTYYNAGEVDALLAGYLPHGGRSFGATMAELLSFYSTKILTARDAFYLTAGSFKRTWNPIDLNYGTTGNGIVTVEGNSNMSLTVSDTGDSCYVRPQSTSLNSLFAAGEGYTVFPRNRTFSLCCLAAFATSQYSDGTVWRLGITRSTSGGPAAESGEMGLLIKGATARVYGYYWNGTSEEHVDLGFNLAAASNLMYEIALIGVMSTVAGQSGFRFLINGNSIGVMKVPGSYYSTAVGWNTVASYTATDLTASPKLTRFGGMSWHMAPSEATIPA